MLSHTGFTAEALDKQSHSKVIFTSYFHKHYSCQPCPRVFISDEQPSCTWQHLTASEVLVATRVKCYQFKQGQF